jgi:hypothetical protein
MEFSRRRPPDRALITLLCGAPQVDARAPAVGNFRSRDTARDSALRVGWEDIHG